MKITIEVRTAVDQATAWRAWTEPEHIQQWNAATDQWHCPHAEVDLRVGGRQVSRMEAKDGSMGFDFAATFTEVDPPHRITFRLDDDRMVTVEFHADGDGTRVVETFDAESESDAEMQRAGWQAILENFARHATTLV